MVETWNRSVANDLSQLNKSTIGRQWSSDQYKKNNKVCTDVCKHTCLDMDNPTEKYKCPLLTGKLSIAIKCLLCGHHELP